MMKQAKGRQMQGLLRNLVWLKTMENLKILKLENSNQIQIHLCRFCYDRNFSMKQMSLVKYSVSISIVRTGIKVCYICTNFFLGTLPSIVNKILTSEMFDQLSVFLLSIWNKRYPFLFYENEDVPNLCSKLRVHWNKSPNQFID